MVKIRRGLLGELGDLHQRMERMMEQALHRHGRTGGRAEPDWCPATDVYETETHVVLMVEVAGVDPDSLEVTLEDNLLRVAGRRPRMAPRRPCLALHQMEIEYGPFERLINVPPRLNGDSAQANLENGFLEIRIPKPPPREEGEGRVEVQSG